MGTKQTEALRVAAESLPMLKIAASLRDGTGQISLHGSHLVNLIDGYDAALHQLQTMRDLGEAGEDVQLLRMGYAARLEIESLQAQLAAVGAGGVSPLMPRPVFGRTGTRDVDVAAAQKAWDAAQAKPPAIGREALMDLIAERLSGTYHCTRVWSAWGVGTMSQDDFEDVGESDTPGELSDEILAAIASQAQPMGAAPAKVLAGVIELAKAAHAHWDADRDAKVGKILMALAGWNEGYDWRADALHAAAAAPQPAVQAPDALQRAGAIAVSAAKTNSRDIADWREDMDRIAAIAAQQGGA